MGMGTGYNPYSMMGGMGYNPYSMMGGMGGMGGFNPYGMMGGMGGFNPYSQMGGGKPGMNSGYGYGNMGGSNMFTPNYSYGSYNPFMSYAPTQADIQKQNQASYQKLVDDRVEEVEKLARLNQNRNKQGIDSKQFAMGRGPGWMETAPQVSIQTHEDGTPILEYNAEAGRYLPSFKTKEGPAFSATTGMQRMGSKPGLPTTS
jgi:hypothetical protein